MKNTNAIHCIGNGNVLAYLQGKDIIQLFGNNYSVPSFLSLKALKGENFCDFVSQNFFVRKAENASFLLNFSTDKNCKYYMLPSHADTIFVEMRRGAFIYNYYPTETTYYLLIKVFGGTIGKNFSVEIDKGMLVFAFGDNFDSLKRELDNFDCEREYQSQKNFWQDFEKNHPVFPETARQIKAQLSSQGAEIAGYAYHLAYIRDNFGTFMGLFSLGMANEAKKLLDYFANTLRTYGKIHNAQGMGQSAFHIHENDDVEITAYLGLMPFIYAQKTNQSLSEYLDVIKWCVERQLPHLHRGMLPFNGDETYIACGMVSRSVLIDGSLEATMLFHTLLKKILNCPEFSSEYKAECQSLIDQIEENFEKNFILNGNLVGNCQEYDDLDKRMIRHGVLECGHGFGISFRNSADRFVCEKCFDSFLERHERKYYEIPSIALSQIFVGGSLIPQIHMQKYLQKIKSDFLKDDISSKSIVGYEVGFLLLAFKNDVEFAKMLRSLLLELCDECGMWAETYVNKIPGGTRCRAWESAINVYALLSD